MNLTKANMKKLLLLIAGGVVLNAAVQHLDLLGVFLRVALGLITPFLAGSAIAFVINVPMRQVEDRLFPPLVPGKKPGRLRRAKRPISFVVTLLLLCGLLAVIFFLILPEIGRTLQNFVDRIPVFAQQTQEWGEQLMEQYPEVVDVLSRISIDWEKLSQGFIDLAQNSMSGVLNSTLDLASSIIGGVVGSVVAIVFAAYILLQKERLGRQFRQLLYAFLPEHHADRITEVGTLSYRTFSPLPVRPVPGGGDPWLHVFPHHEHPAVSLCAHDQRADHRDSADPDFRRVYRLYCGGVPDPHGGSDAGALVCGFVPDFAAG